MLTLWVVLLVVFILAGKGLEFVSASIAIAVVIGVFILFLLGLGALALVFTLI